MTGQLMIYACGGAGTNIGLPYRKTPSQEGFAEIDVAFVDTSHSNFPADIDQAALFCLPDVDGSGKIRAQNYSDIANNIPQILARFPAGDFNIVIYSASGGSGSVFGPMIHNELVKHGKPTVSIVVGSWESLITTTNTLNTIKSLDNLARQNKHPLVMSFFNNQDNSKRKQVDDQIRYYISLLACLVSRHHRELDSSDIENWIRYDRNPTNQTPPQLANLDLCADEEEVSIIAYPISIASLHTGASNIGSIGADYQCAGIISGEVATAIGYEQHHFVITVNDIPELVKSITERKEALIAKQQARPKMQALVSGDTAATIEGMVL